MKLEVYDDVYKKLVEYVRQMHPQKEEERQKEQIENDIVILDAEKSLLKDRIDEGYRVIDK